MTAPQPSPGLGEFGLDLDKAREAVTELRLVHAQLIDLRAQAYDLVRQPRTAFDAVSVESFDLLAQKASGGPESLAEAVNGGMKHVEELIAQMDSDIAAQERNDAYAARDMNRS